MQTKFPPPSLDEFWLSRWIGIPPNASKDEFDLTHKLINGIHDLIWHSSVYPFHFNYSALRPLVSELVKHPNICRCNEATLSGLLQLLQKHLEEYDQRLFGEKPVLSDEERAEILNPLRMIIKKLTAVVDTSDYDALGKAYRARQHSAAKKGGEKISEKASPFKAAVLAERDRLLREKKVPPSERSMASIIATKLHRSFNTVRDVLRKNRG